MHGGWDRSWSVCTLDVMSSCALLRSPAGFMSIASVFVNKAIFQVYKFKHPYTLVLGQTTFTLVLLLVMRRLHVIRLAPFQFHVLQRVSHFHENEQGMTHEINLGPGMHFGTQAKLPQQSPFGCPWPVLRRCYPSPASMKQGLVVCRVHCAR